MEIKLELLADVSKNMLKPAILAVNAWNKHAVNLNTPMVILANGETYTVSVISKNEYPTVIGELRAAFNALFWHFNDGTA